MARGPALIGVDWGTSNLRALLLAPDGAILDRSEGAHGILTVAGGDFSSVLAAAIGNWLQPEIPVLLSGMIGSRQGWVEAPYAEVPVGAVDLAAALARVPFDDADVRIVPGVKATANTVPDVLRGEEVQVLGAMAQLGVDRGRFVVPGTHSKWVMAEGGRLAGFTTYMTGDVYGALRRHTILGRLMEDAETAEEAREAFDRGVYDGAREGTPGALLNRLFAVRTMALFDRFAPAELPDYLSGLLIGAEIADQIELGMHPAHIIASHALAERYDRAAEALGLSARVVPADSITGGYIEIARLAGLI